MHDSGYVGILGGHGWSAPSGDIVQRGMQPRLELEPGVMGFRSIERARLGPDLADLGDLPPPLWPEALQRWSRLGRKRFAEVGGWLRIADVEPLVSRLGAVGPRLLHRLSPADAWSMALAPIDVDKPGRAPLLHRLARAVVGDETLDDLVDPRQLDGAGPEGAEEVADQAAILRWFTRRWQGAGGITSAQADALEAAASELISRTLDREIRSNRYGRCRNCGRPTVPGRAMCDACWRGTSVPRGDRIR
jgi:hypothetical protein